MSHRIPRIMFAIMLATAGASSLAAGTSQRSTPSRPLSVSPADEGKRVEAKNGVVASANALASEAGLEMLRAGGNAVDAAVATAFAIGVVEPQMSGLGGSGAATVWMKRDGKPAYLDFYAAQPADSWRGHTQPAPRPAAPGAAPASGQPQGQESEGQEGGPRIEPGDLRVVGVPGNVAGLLTLHEKFGKLSREQVMAPAIRIAEEGFPVGQILADFIVSGEKVMKPFPTAYALYFPNGKAGRRVDLLVGKAESGVVQEEPAAPGGGRIPTEIVQVFVYTLDYGLDPLDAVKIPRIFPSARNPRVQIEHGFTPQILRDVRAMGYEPVAESAGYARLYMIVRRGDSWIGVADTRHDGEPRGY